MPDYRFKAPRPCGYRLRRMTRCILGHCAACLTPARFSRGREVGILTYHRVVPAAGGWNAPTWSVTPDALERQLAGLLERGFRPLALSALISALEGGTELLRKSFAVTFDDGYQNNYDYAWPVLERYQVPATVFLATQYLGGCAPFPFEDWQPALRRRAHPRYWRPLSREHCLRMQESGLVEFGSHTHSHQCFLGRLDEFRQDLEESLAVLERDFGIRRPAFSFPFGFTRPEMVSVVKSLPFNCGLTTRMEPLAVTDDLFDLGRFSVEQCDNPRTLTAKLDGRYNVLSAALIRCRLAGGWRWRSQPVSTRRGGWQQLLRAVACPRSTRS